ncbi:class A beta-lactamase [Terribacillus saccharophilus]|uniref:Beta-lactamase n=1 Tax=Terribacillus saccharophilus TaxID=361277 RepID=A0A268HGY2_9BACI|nr:class A beta-lactamase [Terribacillus saccharophilus]PAE09137.1 class A beta-lactamase [Terribacillus saccharophilus]
MKQFTYIFFAFCFLYIATGCSGDSGETKSTDAIVSNDKASFSSLEETYDARLGVFAIDTGSGRTVAYRENERFGFASTHKALSVGVLLQQKSIEDLNKRVMFTGDDLVNYNPITEKHVDSGMTLKELSEASISYSDNTAANLIFEEIGGPDGFEDGLRKIGDQVTNSERIEPDLNNTQPGNTRDTSTPKAMAESLREYALRDHLSADKRQLLVDWLKGNTTGDALIRAGVPKDWEVGDKTGAGSYGTRNDIAILWPPDEEPIVLAIMSDHDEADANANDDLIAEAAEAAVLMLSANK